MKIVYSVEKSVAVRNLNSAAKTDTCTCPDLLSHWKKYSKLAVQTCAINGCEEKASIGSAVTRPKAKNKEYKTQSYIIPLCQHHATQFGQVLEVKENSTFVRAETDEKKR